MKNEMVVSSFAHSRLTLVVGYFLLSVLVILGFYEAKRITFTDVKQSFNKNFVLVFVHVFSATICALIRFRFIKLPTHGFS